MSGRSAAWLARLPWEQEVGRSNRLAPTISYKLSTTIPSSFFEKFEQNVNILKKNGYNPVK